VWEEVGWRRSESKSWWELLLVWRWMAYSEKGVESMRGSGVEGRDLELSRVLVMVWSSVWLIFAT
jgi:hypothetical protein